MARLFLDVVAVERDDYAAMGIFPIMHVVVMRRAVYEQNPRVAQSLQKAFVAARDLAYTGLTDASALRVTSPWLI